MSFALFGHVFPASLCPLLTSLSDWTHFSFPVFRPSPCRYSDTPLTPVLYNTDSIIIEGTLHLAFRPPSFRFFTIGLLSRYCCYSDTLMALVLRSANNLIIGIDNTLHLQAPFPSSLRYMLFWHPDNTSLILC